MEFILWYNRNKQSTTILASWSMKEWVKMMSKFPDSISITFLNRKTQEPIENIAAEIKLFANLKNDYCFILPLSDKKGNVTITKGWITNEITKEQNLFIMDYGSNIDDCKLQIEISVLGVENLSRAIDAMYLYQDYSKITDTEIQRYKNSKNFNFISDNRIVIFNDSSKVSIDIFLLQRI